MPLDPNNEFLRQQLESMSLLNGRYSNIRLVNYDASTDRKRGAFSMVFRAFDEVDQRDVALKFYDQDPARKTDLYRIQAFHREHQILQNLLNIDRCLQLTSAFETCTVRVQLGGVPDFTIAADFFAVEWLDEEVDSFFLSHGSYSPIERLRLFNEVVLAVEALHAHEVFHRDLKADNMRGRQVALKRVVVAIDLGAAARFDSGAISPSYTHQVGAPGYAAPEALCGLAGNRVLAPYTDLYAIGCLLFELFNPNYFFQAVRDCNRGLDLRFHAMISEMAGCADPQDQILRWHGCLTKYNSGVAPVQIDGIGSTVPPGVASILNEILWSLTSFDYRKRPYKSAWLKQKLWSAIRALENERDYKRRLALSKLRRQRKRQAILDKVERLEAARRDRRLHVDA